MQTEKEYNFGKRKGNQAVIVSGNKEQSKQKSATKSVQKPAPNTNNTDWFRKFHKGHPQGK